MDYKVDFTLLRNVADIAAALSCAPALIGRVIGGEVEFKQHFIPKRDSRRGKREVWSVVEEPLLEAYRAFALRFYKFAVQAVPGFPHSAVHGYLPGRSIVTNAKAHIGASTILRADISNFFGSISTARVETLLRDLELAREVATVLARFLTVEGKLPLGFPSSPLLANLAAHKLDNDLAAIAAAEGCVYTRYADDLTFSGATKVPARISIESALRASGFELAGEKWRVKKRGQALYVTGLSVSTDVQPYAPKAFKRRLIQELHYAKKYGLRDHLGRAGYSSYQAGINKIDGRIRFLHSVEPALARDLLVDWVNVLSIAGAAVAYEPNMALRPRDVSIFVDESETDKAFFVGCAIVEDVEVLTGYLVDLRETLLADPFQSGRKSALGKKGLHWTEVSEDIRTRIVELVSRLPVRVYVAYAALPSSADYEGLYLRLLEELLQHRLIGLDRATVKIFCETTTKVRAAEVSKMVAGLYARLESINSRRPRATPSVEIATKLQHPPVAIVDAALGVLGAYATSEGRQDEQAVSRFERLRLKYRLIRSGFTGEVFSRRSPFVPWKEKNPSLRSK